MRQTKPIGDVGDPLVTKVLDLVEGGMDVDPACDQAGIKRPLFYYRLKRIPAAQERFDRIRAHSKVIKPGPKPGKPQGKIDFPELVSDAFKVVSEAMNGKLVDKSAEVRARLAVTVLEKFKEHARVTEDTLDIVTIYARFPGFEAYMANKELIDQILAELKKPREKPAAESPSPRKADPYEGMGLSDRLKAAHHEKAMIGKAEPEDWDGEDMADDGGESEQGSTSAPPKLHPFDRHPTGVNEINLGYDAPDAGGPDGMFDHLAVDE